MPRLHHISVIYKWDRRDNFNGFLVPLNQRHQNFWVSLRVLFLMRCGFWEAMVTVITMTPAPPPHNRRYLTHPKTSTYCTNLIMSSGCGKYQSEGWGIGPSPSPLSDIRLLPLDFFSLTPSVNIMRRFSILIFLTELFPTLQLMF